MDRTAIVKMLAGTATRGVMWVLAYISARFGIENVSDETSQAVGYFLASTLVAAAATAWSWHKNRKLLAAAPPAK
ncbi:MAG: hypothetical protein HZA50_04395 [Planctomycetes bacterium]|nr:hypothetical protein [Planctomycetota bacterium]